MKIEIEVDGAIAARGVRMPREIATDKAPPPFSAYAQGVEIEGGARQNHRRGAGGCDARGACWRAMRGRQHRQAWANVAAVLEAGGMTLSDITEIVGIVTRAGGRCRSSGRNASGPSAINKGGGDAHGGGAGASRLAGRDHGAGCAGGLKGCLFPGHAACLQGGPARPRPFRLQGSALHLVRTGEGARMTAARDRHHRQSSPDQ